VSEREREIERERERENAPPVAGRYKLNLISLGGSDHVTLIGHAMAGMGYRNELQTENYGSLANQALFLYGVCFFSHVKCMSMLKFAHILNIA